ncbi:MAG TPA: hypothetical protein VEA36_01520 [Candidatus Paceibacterota bacterium]|nr:hypothetical protein [Candidatus Paceibacterota bacterium]
MADYGGGKGGEQGGKMKDLLTGTEIHPIFIPRRTVEFGGLFNRMRGVIIEKEPVPACRNPLSPPSTPLIIVAI